MIHFLRPEWLLALIPLALMLWQLRRNEQQQSSWTRYIAPHLAKVLVSTQAQSKKSNLNVITFSWLVAVIALSGPAFTKQSLPVFEANQGRVIVMDMSLSMYATDLAPNRLTQAKFKATDLINSLTEGETGLVAYAGDAFTISPLTRDMSTLLNLLPTLSPQIMPVRGSNLPAALTQAKNLLAQGGHLRGDIILLTDGVANEQINAASSVLSDSQYRLSIIALGSAQGAPIRLPDGQLMRDNSDQIVVPKTDHNELSTIASANGGNLYPYRADGGDLLALNQWLEQSQSTKASDLEGETWLDLGSYIALLLLLPALMSFRHAIAALACLMLAVPPSPAYADSWQHPWQTDDQRAMEAYNQQDYQQAAKLFSDPNWQAAAHYRNGDYEQALEQYEKDNSATGLYNQGNSLMQLQDLDGAIKRYEQAIAKNPSLAEAKDNLALAKQLKQQQQNSADQNQQSQDNQDNQQQQNSDQQNQQQDPSQGGDEQQSSKEQQSGDLQSGDQQGQDSQSSQQGSQEQTQNEQSQQQDGTNDDKNSQSDANTQSDESQQSDGTPQDNEAQMSADPEQQQEQPRQASAEQAANDDSQPQTEQSMVAAQTDTDAQNASESKEEVQAMTNAIAPEDLPPEMQRALTGVIDDPQVLLRNKMQLEYQKRRRQGVTSKDSEQW